MFAKFIRNIEFPTSKYYGSNGVIFWVRVAVIVAATCASLTLIDFGLRKTPLKVILGV